MKDFDRAMLEFFGHPDRTTGTTAQFAQRALDRVLSCEGWLLPEELGRLVAGPAPSIRLDTASAGSRWTTLRASTRCAESRRLQHQHAGLHRKLPP
jgi:hypothetical protein